MKTTIFSTIMLSALALTACSDDTFSGDAPRDWSGQDTLYVQAEDARFQTYYKPEIGRVGDPMPFYDEKAGEFKVLYLQEFSPNDPFCYHPIYGVSTKDGATYQGMGEVLPTGKSRNEADAALGTGCCVYNEKEGLYYIYYTGHTSNEVIMRATSPDFKTWTKDRVWMIKGIDFECYEAFRDPHIFKTDDGVYHMLLTARPTIAKDPFFMEFTSSDMKDWKFVTKINNLWERMYECPDVFKMGNKWYIVYSDSNRANWGRSVKYMMADSWDELKDKFRDSGKVDREQKQLDSRAFYAGKTASNGTDRYIWGWTPFRSGEDIHAMNLNVGSGGEPNWSGALVCHKLIQLADGSLSTAEVPAMAAKYNKSVDLKVKAKTDDYTMYDRLGTHNHISFTAKAISKDDRFGVSFCRGSEKWEEKDEKTGKMVQKSGPVRRYYTLVVNPEGDNRKINFEQNGPGVEPGKEFIEGGDGYLFPVDANNTYKVDIYTDNSVIVMYVNGKYGYTQRIHGLQKNCWSINTYGKNVTISDVKVSEY
ncbi:MAG: DUF4975 domain-containing protein [Prevotella sp.]|nr:DUF4975 domain-containing protein [Prevotella sp.]